MNDQEKPQYQTHDGHGGVHVTQVDGIEYVAELRGRAQRRRDVELGGEPQILGPPNDAFFALHTTPQQRQRYQHKQRLASAKPWPTVLYQGNACVWVERRPEKGCVTFAARESEGSANSELRNTVGVVYRCSLR